MGIIRAFNESVGIFFGQYEPNQFPYIDRHSKKQFERETPLGGYLGEEIASAKEFVGAGVGALIAHAHTMHFIVSNFPNSVKRMLQGKGPTVRYEHNVFGSGRWAREPVVQREERGSPCAMAECYKNLDGCEIVPPED